MIDTTNQIQRKALTVGRQDVTDNVKFISECIPSFKRKFTRSLNSDLIIRPVNRKYIYRVIEVK